MTRTLRIAAFGAAASARMSVEITEGMGLGHSQAEARMNAVRAWVN